MQYALEEIMQYALKENLKACVAGAYKHERH